MDNNTRGFTSYWRNTLADAESGKGAFERKDDDSFARWMTVEAGKLSEEIVHSLFDGEDAQVKTVEVLLTTTGMDPSVKAWQRADRGGSLYRYTFGYLCSPEPRRIFVSRIACHHSP